MRRSPLQSCRSWYSPRQTCCWSCSHHRSNCPIHAPRWWSRSWRSLSNSSSFSHRSFVLIARVGRFERFGVIILLNNFCISCRWAADWLISWSGHPRLSHCWAPVYRGCPCRDPPVWWLIQAGWWVTKGPTLFCCSALEFCCTHCTLDVFTCNITKLDQCCVLILRRKKIKPKREVTWRDLNCWKINWSWHAPSAMRVHFRIHNRAAEVFSRSSTRSLRPVSVFLSLLDTVRFTWFLIRIISCPLTSITLPTVENLVFNLRLLFRLSVPWPDLVGFTLITGFLIFLVTLLPRRSRFHLHSLSWIFVFPSFSLWLSFSNVSLVWLFSSFWLSLFSPFFIFSFDIPSCHSKKHRCVWTISVSPVADFWKKRKESVLFSCFLFSPLPLNEKLFFRWTFLMLTPFETSACFSLFLKKKTLHFDLHQCNTFRILNDCCAFQFSSFCSSSIHLFSVFGSSRVFRFFHLCFSPFPFLHFFLLLDCVFVFSTDNLSWTSFWIFVNFC